MTASGADDGTVAAMLSAFQGVANHCSGAEAPSIKCFLRESGSGPQPLQPRRWRRRYSRRAGSGRRMEPAAPVRSGRRGSAERVGRQGKSETGRHRAFDQPPVASRWNPRCRGDAADYAGVFDAGGLPQRGSGVRGTRGGAGAAVPMQLLRPIVK
jgi:hypothetical protein